MTMADNTTIQVSRQARDHLAQVARERGVTLGQLVEQLASEQPTAAQLAERVAADRQVVRDVIGVDISDEEFEKAPDVLGNIYKIAAEKARAARGAAA
jgi:capsular polysaccharide biosynthesis protein